RVRRSMLPTNTRTPSRRFATKRLTALPRAPYWPRHWPNSAASKRRTLRRACSWPTTRASASNPSSILSPFTIAPTAKISPTATANVHCLTDFASIGGTVRFWPQSGPSVSMDSQSPGPTIRQRAARGPARMSEKPQERRLAAILATDVVGYSRMMQADEAGTLAALKARRAEVLQPLVTKHKGRVVKLMGDGALIEFASAVNAVNCAVALQSAMTEANAGLTENNRIVLRIGINLGDVIVEGSDLYGDGVNIAA